MSTGSVMLGNPGQPFECGHEHGTGDRCLVFNYTPELFERSQLDPNFSVHRIPPIAEIAQCVVEARLAIDKPGGVIFEELGYGLVEAVVRVSETRSRASRAPTASDERRVSATLRFIESNLAESLPLPRLASGARMSEFHFLRVFKQVTGVTPHQYILRSRLREAAVRLKMRSNDVLEIALDTGFPDLSNFNHAFRTEFGVSPARFRANSRVQPGGLMGT
jgi:AraC-like DNA-binding protein